MFTGNQKINKINQMCKYNVHYIHTFLKVAGYILNFLKNFLANR